MSNIEKTKKLIKEGYTNIQDNFTSAMINVKKNNPDLSHVEIMDLLQTEFDRFMKFHKEKLELPNIKSRFKDKIPVRAIAYGNKRK